MWTVFWLALIAVALVAEFVALWNEGVPLTHVYLRLVCSTFLRVILFGFFFWMLWHWMTQPWLWADTTAFAYIDFVFVALGMAVGWRLGPPKWGADCGEV